MTRIILAVHLCLAGYVANAVEYAQIWKADGTGGFSAPNVLRLPTGESLIVICEGNTGVVCFDLSGERRWQHTLTAPVTAAPAVADIDGDGTPDVLAADGIGTLAVLRANGELLWQTNVKAGVNADSSPAAADLDGDGYPEILIGDTGGTLSCFDREGRLKWSFTGDGGQMGPTLSADLYDTPGLETFVTSSDRHIYALDSRGNWLWDLYAADDLFPNSLPVVADVDGNHVPELYVGGGLHHFYRIDLVKPSITLAENVYLHINGAISATDLDGDGRDEVIFGNKGGAVYCYGDGGFRWIREREKSNQYAAPVFINMNEDAELEALLYSQRGDLEVLDKDGNTLFTTMTACNPSATPLAGDFDGDGTLDLIATTAGGFSGRGSLVYATLGVPYRKNARERSGFASNPAHTGFAGPSTYSVLKTPSSQEGSDDCTVAAFGDIRITSGPNTWRYDIGNPRGLRLAFVTELRAPDGSVRRFVRHVRGNTERAVLYFESAGSGTYTAAQKLIDADRLAIFRENTTAIQFHGLESDRAYLEEEIFPEIQMVLSRWKETNSLPARGAEFTLKSLQGALAQLAQDEDSDPAMTARVIEEAQRLRQLTAAAAALAPKGTFVVWAMSPWAYYHPRETLPEAQGRLEGLDVALCKGEYESLALNVTNVTAQTLTVRAMCRNADGTEGPAASRHITFRRAVLVPTERREVGADALPSLDSAGSLSISPYETAQLWITVDAVDLAAGEHEFEIVIKSVEPDPTERVVPLRMKVHPFELPRPRPLRFCLWAYDGGDLGTDRPDVLRDLVEHGVTIFFGTAPNAQCDAEGNLERPLDYTASDESIRRLAPHGMLLFLSPQARIKGVPFLSEAWKKAFIAYLQEWTEHMKALGLDYGDWALYPYDEPSTPFADTTINLVKVAKVIREADPNILIYTDPTSGTTMETVKMFTGLVDIWCPSAELLERLGDELVPEAKRVGKEVWFYDASGGAKTLSCLGLYRWRFWYAWNMGFTGAGWWTYAHHGPDRWDGPNATGDYFATVYDGPDEPVSSKRWEAAREGVEDYEYLYLLRQAIKEAQARGVTESQLADAIDLLNTLPKEMATTLQLTGRRLPLTPDSVPVYEDATQKLAEARARIVAICLEVRDR